MDLKAAATMAIDLMRHHGLFEKGYSFKWMHAKTANGYCNYTDKTIGLSKPLTAVRNEDRVLNTILHEIAHALCPERGHGQAWKLLAVSIGAEPKRCGDIAAEGIEAPKGQWNGVCPAGHTANRFRRPKKLTSCSACAPYFSRNHLFTWTHESGVKLLLETPR